MSIVITAKDLIKGKTAEWSKSGVLSQPVQLLPKEEKNEQWRHENLDWWEHIGVLQLREKYKRLIKNYNLAEGIIDKTDYIPDSSINQYGDMINILTKENETPYEIRFYPLVPSILNVLTGEFAKRNNTVMVKAIDEYAINEMLDKKKEMISDYLIQQTKQKIALKLTQLGVPLDGEEAQGEFKNAMNLPEIQQFFNKSYRSIAEQWATHELAEAEERFKIYELEAYSFRDKLIASEQYWHVRLLEDDYEVEIWNPMNTFVHRSPSIPYVSGGSYVGRIHLLTIADVVDRFGHKMKEEQIKSLQVISNSRANLGKLAPVDAMPTDFYDPSKPKDKQITSIHWNQAVTSQSIFDGVHNRPLFEWLTEDKSFSNDFLIVTEVYWKSQKRMGHLKEIKEDGVPFEDVVTEDFVVTIKPKYDNTLKKEESADTLIYGQHIDWFWVNEVWQGVKIGLSFINSWAGISDGFEPIYLDIKPLPFQYKSDSSLYNAKLPVEGFLGYNRNVRRQSLVDRTKPFQVGYNMVNNQMFDLLVDEIGNIILLDQNMIPKNSMDGSWGKHNFSKAFQVMKNFNILPIDSSITNTDVPVNFSQTSVVSLEKTNQLASRVQLSEYFKNECFSAVGITPQRLGEIAASESATGVQQAVNNSYAQTEFYFIEHSSYLMPRVKEMILNAAQYVNANRATVRKAYINKEEENIFFEIDGTRLLLSDLKIYTTSKPDQKAILDQLKQLAMSNNTSSATIYDLAKIVQSQSVSEILETLKKSVDQMQQQQQAQLESQNQQTQATIQAGQENQNKQMQFEATQAELDRENERYIAALKSDKPADIDQNGISDSLEIAKFSADLSQYNQELGFKGQQEDNKTIKDSKDRNLKGQELDLKRQELNSKVKLKEKEIALAKENMKNDLAVAKANARGRSKSK